MYPMNNSTPAALTPAELSAALIKSGARHIDEKKILADIAADAPTNTDGTLSLLTYAAWLVKERGHGA